MAKYTSSILRCKQRKICKVCLAILQHYGSGIKSKATSGITAENNAKMLDYSL